MQIADSSLWKRFDEVFSWPGRKPKRESMKRKTNVRIALSAKQLADINAGTEVYFKTPRAVIEIRKV